MENEIRTRRVLRPKLKIFLLSTLCLGLIVGSLFIFRKSPSVASYSYHESLKIASSSLNGNSIWGGGETFETIVSAGGLDDWAAFYSATNKSSGGLPASGSLSIDGVPYQLGWTGASDYTGNDTIRLYSGHESATITLDTIGAYEKLYVLGTAGGPGEGNYANFAVRVHYTDGTSDETNYRLYDWYDSTAVSGVYKWPNLARRVIQGTTSGYGNNNTTTYNYEGSTSGAPYLQSATISVNSKKLVFSIDLVLTGLNGKSSTDGIFCGIYAITGMVNVSAPNPVEVIYVDAVSETTADIRWEAVARATSYRLDIALDPDFKNILPDYNNLAVQDTSLTATGLSGNTTYYTRVRAENSEGQSISSDVVSFTTDPETIPPTISVIANPGLIQIKDDAVIIGVDASGVKEIDESLDGGATWTKLADGDRAEREITENGTYCYRAIDNFDNISEKTCITYSNLDTAKPVIRVNTNGYLEGSWTNSLVTLTIESLTINVGTTSYYYSEDGVNWQPYANGVVVAEETSADGKTYYFKAVSQAGVESDVVSATVLRDTTAPTGEIQSSDNGWNQFLNTITFGLFFNETKNFFIETSDDLSGVASVEYLTANTTFDSKESALAATGWQTYNDAVALNPEGDFVLYFKVTDNAGNVSVVNTDGIVLDATDALIEGYVDADHTYPLEDGKTYYLAQKLIVTDNRALDSITVNGNPVAVANNIISLSPNQTYAIEARDKAGNLTSLTIHTGSLGDYTLDLNNDNFKTSDDSRLETAKEKLEEIKAAEGDHATEAELDTLDDLIARYDDLRQQIADLEAEIKDEADRGAAVPDIDRLTSDDRENIEQILVDINATLDEDGIHLTIEENNNLLIEKRELEDKLRRLDEVDEQLAELAIVNQTNTDIIKTSDESELEDLKQTAESLLDSNNLTEGEREQVEEELAKINDLLDRIDEAVAAENTSDIHDVDDIIPIGYTIDDKTDLEEAKDDLETALADYGNNYTDEERESLQEKLDDIIRALDDIESQIWDEIVRTTFPTLTVTSETTKWLAMDVAGVSASDDYSVASIEVSRDGGETWTLITNLESGTYDVEQNGTYIFRATNEFGNTKEETVVYHNIDPVKPVVEVNPHGYRLGTWTNQPVTLSASNIAANISPVALYYREADSETWLPYTSSLLVTSDTDAKTYEFKAIAGTGVESDVVSAEVKKDAVVPTGTISTGENSLNAFLHTVTFGLLFNETKTYEMSATDDRSGIDTIEYIVSDTELSADELKASTDWATTGGTVSVAPDKTVNIYYRLTDHAGNVAVLSQNGIVFDLPGLSNVDVSLTNQTAGYVTVTTGSGTVTVVSDLEHTNVNDLDNLNASESELAHFLENHADDSTSVVSDLLVDYQNAIAAIEETEEKVAIIEDSYATIPPLDSVTSRDEVAVEALIAAIEETEANNGNHLTPEEKQELDAMLDDLNQKLAIIEEIKEQLTAVDTGVNDYGVETVSKDDLDELEELKSQIEDLLENSHVADEEKEHLNELLGKIAELEQRIKDAEKALEEAEQNDHAGNITPNNVTPEDQTTLEDALNGYTEALGVFDSNLSLADLFDVNNKISIINSALDILDQVAEFEAMISRLPNPEDVNYNSRALIKAAEGAYNALSEYGRTLVGPSLLARYRAVLDAYRAYLEGSPILYAFETLDVFWWGLTTFAIVGIFVFILRRTRNRYIEAVEDSDDF